MQRKILKKKKKNPFVPKYKKKKNDENTDVVRLV